MSDEVVIYDNDDPDQRVTGWRKPDGHAHIYHNPNCVAIGLTVCASPVVHGGDPGITDADGAIAGGPDEHLAGFTFSHDVEGQLWRCEGAVNVDPHLAPRPLWAMTGTLEGGDLSLDPSILCGDGFHGYITAGQWVPA